ncbi:MAG TPA: hypothetical protein VD978_26760 [Azospirillum sp.]|nr:hypothetical protein [Azospirillum sp.]
MRLDDIPQRAGEERTAVGTQACCATILKASTLESWLRERDGPPPFQDTAAPLPQPSTSEDRAEQNADWQLTPFLAAGAGSGLAGVPIPLVIVVAPPIAPPDAQQAPETFVLISRLPPKARISHGRSLGDGTWRVPLEELDNLTMTVPPEYAGTAKITVTAVTDHGGGVTAKQAKDLSVPIHSWNVDSAPPPQPATHVPDPKPEPPHGAPAIGPSAPSSVERSTTSPPAEALALRSAAPTPAPAPAAKAVATTAVPEKPQRKQAEPAAIKAPPIVPEPQLLKRGDELFTQGDLAGARLFYEMAASNGSELAALALGKTYDPLIHKRLRVRGLSPDPEQAADWYGRATASGNAEAKQLLKELTAWLAAQRH